MVYYTQAQGGIMWKKMFHRLTWVDVPDGGGGYPQSWRKGPGDYLAMPVQLVFVALIVLIAIILTPLIWTLGGTSPLSILRARGGYRTAKFP